MADDKKDEAARNGQALNLVRSGKPHTVSFNERTGKAATPSNQHKSLNLDTEAATPPAVEKASGGEAAAENNQTAQAEISGGASILRAERDGDTQSTILSTASGASTTGNLAAPASGPAATSHLHLPEQVDQKHVELLDAGEKKHENKVTNTSASPAAEGRIVATTSAAGITKINPPPGNGQTSNNHVHLPEPTKQHDNELRDGSDPRAETQLKEASALARAAAHHLAGAASTGSAVHPAATRAANPPGAPGATGNPDQQDNAVFLQAGSRPPAVAIPPGLAADNPDKSDKQLAHPAPDFTRAPIPPQHPPETPDTPPLARDGIEPDHAPTNAKERQDEPPPGLGSLHRHDKSQQLNLSINAEAIAKVHQEEQRAMALNKKMDQLEAKMKQHKH
jgi:hypothetical protein